MLETLRKRFYGWQHACVVAVLLMLTSLPTSLQAKGMTDGFMSTHREWSFTSSGYVQTIAKELHISEDVVRDFVNAYTIYIAHGIALVSADHLLASINVSDRPRIMNALCAVFWAHRIAYWTVSGAHYIPEKTLAFLTHGAIYQTLLWSVGLVPYAVQWTMNGNGRGKGIFASFNIKVK